MKHRFLLHVGNSQQAPQGNVEPDAMAQIPRCTWVGRQQDGPTGMHKLRWSSLSGGLCSVEHPRTVDAPWPWPADAIAGRTPDTVACRKHTLSERGKQDPKP